MPSQTLLTHQRNIRLDSKVHSFVFSRSASDVLLPYLPKSLHGPCGAKLSLVLPVSTEWVRPAKGLAYWTLELGDMDHKDEKGIYSGKGIVLRGWVGVSTSVLTPMLADDGSQLAVSLETSFMADLLFNRKVRADSFTKVERFQMFVAWCQWCRHHFATY